MQTPLPVMIGGGSAFGPIPKVAAGNDVVGCVTRYQRYAAIARIRPESTGTIGSVARQSYQYVRPLVPDPRPFNAFGNPVSPTGQPIRSRRIADTIPPALEPPRYNYNGQSQDYLQEQNDILMTKALLMERQR
jgi:hypothetical protein